ncbi:MAG: hypothetical protein K6E10_12035 [Eubacterium sp.]|nr:hypothetical protein [Eubacterium sp.]
MDTEDSSVVLQHIEVTQELTEEIPEITAIQLEKVDKASEGDSDEESDPEEDEVSEEEAERQAEIASETNARLRKELSDDLFSQQFIFGDKLLTLPFDYGEISDKYTFDLADYGYEDGLILEPGQRVAGTVELEAYDLDEGIVFWVGFINDSEQSLDIKDSKVNSFRMDTRWIDEDDYPTLILPGDITWKCTEEDIYKAYGEPEEEPYRSEDSKYTTISYDSGDYNYYIEFVVYDNIGLSEVSLRAY